MKFKFNDNERDQLAARLGLSTTATDADIQAGLTRLFSATPLSASAAPVLAAANVEDVRRAFYDNVAVLELPDWSWIRSINLEPDELIVDDDDGSLYRVPFAIEEDEEVTFAEPIKVRVEYITAANGVPVPKLRGNSYKTVVVTFDTKEASAQPVKKVSPKAAVAAPAGPPAGVYLNECEAAIAAAIAQDKIPAARADRYRRRWERDPAATAKLLDTLASVPGLNTGAFDDPEPTAYPREWLAATEVATLPGRSRVQGDGD
jgi:hypothetical protein